MKASLHIAESHRADILAEAVTMVAEAGISAIHDALDKVQSVRIDLLDDQVQPLIAEAVFQLLDNIDADPAAFETYAIIAALPPAVADLASNLLVLANFGGEGGNMADLSDSTVLLLAALNAAAGRPKEAMDFLLRSQYTRSAEPFKRAAFQLRCILQNDMLGVVETLTALTMDDLDHPEIWPCLSAIVRYYPAMTEEFSARAQDFTIHCTNATGIFHALCVAAEGRPAEALALLEPIAVANSLSTMAQGAYFYINSLLDSDNPRFDLTNRFCTLPFETLDVLDGTTHLCCASYVKTSVGDLSKQPWEQVWNSEAAQDIRASILDGSFRYCNKTACPHIGSGGLPIKEETARTSDRWRDVIDNNRIILAPHLERVNLAYDRTCNLSCPSCRTEKIAADSATRKRYDALQEHAILPLLRHTKTVFITGSGDPFASKNFRQLLERLGPDDYPDLRFQVMTNGMLFTRREWERFPALHGRVAFLRISLDAATGPTHELLRRGARWPVMEDNLAFAAELRAAGLIDRLDLTFVVQTENYREMGDAVDLAKYYGADEMSFFRITNWGTYSNAQFAKKTVFMESHPEHEDFLTAMRDPRLRDPVAGMYDLTPFLAA